jgi:hypothetical protein
VGIPIGTVAVNDQTGHKIVLTDKGWQELGNQQMPLPEADSKVMESLQGDVQQKQWLDQKAQQFIKGMDPQKPGQGSFATGPGYSNIPIPFMHGDIPNPVAGAVGLADPRMGDLKSITNQAWIHMRPEGSGAIRGYEAKDFKAAFPSVEHTGPTNQQIAERMHQDALVASHKLQYIDQFIRSGHGDYAQANAAWQQQFGGGQPPPQQAPQQPPAIQPPMQMQSDPRSPIGAVPVPGAQLPPQLTQQQQQILNWTPEKGLHP